MRFRAVVPDESRADLKRKARVIEFMTHEKHVLSVRQRVVKIAAGDARRRGVGTKLPTPSLQQ